MNKSTGGRCCNDSILLNEPHLKSCGSVIQLHRFRMAWEEGRGCQSYLAVAVVLVLCTLAPSLTCFSLRGLGEDIEQKKGIEEAAVMEVRTGSILFDGKALDSQLRSASAAATRAHGVVNADFDHLDGTGMPSLSCCA